MTLLQTQQTFSTLIARLLLLAKEMGYSVTFGQAYRSEAQAAVYAQEKKGIPNSLHTSRLAIDLNLFQEDKYLDKTEDHLPLGEAWEKMGKKIGVETVWGGRFSKPDGNHYSIKFGGVS
jgi:hypothetical protein